MEEHTSLLQTYALTTEDYRPITSDQWTHGQCDDTDTNVCTVHSQYLEVIILKSSPKR